MTQSKKKNTLKISVPESVEAYIVIETPNTRFHQECDNAPVTPWINTYFRDKNWKNVTPNGIISNNIFQLTHGDYGNTLKKGEYTLKIINWGYDSLQSIDMAMTVYQVGGAQIQVSGY